MKLHFLGTGAADWDIRHPQKGKDYRRFSSVLVDETLLIDPGPCVFEFAETYGYPKLTENVKTVICTHKHSDHFSTMTLERLSVPLTEVPYYETVETDNYKITAYPANHGTAEEPRHYVIESKNDGKRFFYGCDGAWMLYPTYKAIRQQHFDLMVFDCTIGDVQGDFRLFEHNSIAMVEIMCQTFAKNSDRFMVSHMARTLHTNHETLKNRLAPLGIVPAYDDMIVEI